MSNNPQIPNPESRQEPTVLDLFKSITKDWRSFFNFISSLFSVERRVEIERVVVEESRSAAEMPQAEAAVFPASGAEKPFPWRAVLGLFLALFAQNMLEPQTRKVELAMALYVFAIGFVLWGYLKEEWRLAVLPPDSERVDPLTVRSVALIVSAILAMIAFYDFGGNLFTSTNVALWVISIALFVFALWLPGAKRIRLVYSRQVMVWGLGILALSGLLIFFRMYRIDGIPAEPFSDHAEKILDVYDVSQGQTHIFFPRNTGREAIQMYWTLLMAKVFGTGLSFLSLKLGTVLLGLFTLPYIYLLGRELGGARAGLFALFLFGIAYWPNVISRIGLRFPLYPLFVASTLFYLMRGLRTRSRNDIVLSGLFLGLGLHGYSPFRIMPFVVAAAFGLYWLHLKSAVERRQTFVWFVLIGFAALIVFLPLLRYALENPDMFSYRALTRLEGIETPLPGPAWRLFLSNLWNALRMFNWDDGEIWVNSLPHRPALDIITGALFIVGIVLLIVRYVRGRDWRDLFLLLSIPLLLMPSILSLAYPGENPALNRAGGAAVPAILVSALALDGLVAGFGSGARRTFIAYGLAAILFAGSAFQNYDLVFHQFDEQYRAGAWNTSEMGGVIKDFARKYGETDTVWIVPFPYWVDTRLPGVWAGIPNRDFAMWTENLSTTLDSPYPKLFMFWPDDAEAEKALKELYPNGILNRYTSATVGKDFMVFFVEK
jgi:dolichyl-phosphate-mannose-protein mannosyltransferase